MKLLTIKNVVGLGLGVFALSLIVDALPDTGSGAYAQSQVVTQVSSVLGGLLPNVNSPSAPSSESLSHLLRVGERTYNVDFDNSISSQVLSSDMVRKIAFGKDTMVTIVSTPSGTYSSDGFASPHVLYPGISVTETTPHADNPALKILLNGQYVDWSTLADTL